MEPPAMLLPVELSPEGIARARRELDRTETILSGARGVAGTDGETVHMGRGAGSAQPPDVVTVYEHARTVPNSRTPSLLELFAREDPLTPEEIGIELGNGQPLTKAQGRAIVRNLSRMQKHLLERGRISRPVLSKHFGEYDREGAGRYGLSVEDRAILRTHIGG